MDSISWAGFLVSKSHAGLLKTCQKATEKASQNFIIASQQDSN
jgi:hypothetical protein